jgi:hypothetical protein
MLVGSLGGGGDARVRNSRSGTGFTKLPSPSFLYLANAPFLWKSVHKTEPHTDFSRKNRSTMSSTTEGTNLEELGEAQKWTPSRPT